MADPGWEPAEQVAKNAEGAHVALLGGKWEPVAQAAKNAEGKFMVFRGAPAAPKAAAPSTQELAKVAEVEESPALVQVGSAMMAPIEGVEQIIAHLRGKGKEADTQAQGRAEAMKVLGEEHPMSRPVGTLTDVAVGGLAPAIGGKTALSRILGATATGGGYAATQPVASGKDFTEEKLKQVGAGGGVAGGITAAIEGLLRAPGKLRGLYDSVFDKPVAAPVPARGEGAGTVATELQRQRDLAEGKKGIPANAAGLSEAERVKADFDGRMGPIKDAAFNTGAKIDTADTLAVIDKMMLQNPDKQVQAALREVKQTIERATKGAANTGLPPAGSNLSTAQLRQMQGQSGQLEMGMADEVRQSINRLREQTGDKALSKHTVDLLTQVRDRFLQNAPKPYKYWIAEHAKGAQELERFKPDAGVLAKTTTDQPGVQPLGSTDAQAKLEGIFGGATAGRDLKDLLDRSRHDPEVREGLKRSVLEWVTPTTQAGKVGGEQAATRWNKSKEAIRQAELFQPEHYSAIDKVMTGLHGADKGGEAAKSAAAAVAWAIGLPFGRPGSAAMAARTAVGRMTGGEKTPQQVENMIQKVMMDPHLAALAASPATPQVLQQFEKALSVGMGRSAAEQEAPRQPQRRVPNPLGMRPAGI